MIDVYDDIRKLMLLSKNTINSISDLQCDCIGHGITERDSNIVECDIGIGILSLYICEDAVSYKFIPSCRLESSIKSAIETNNSPLIKKAEESLVNKISSTYKDIFNG